MKQSLIFLCLIFFGLNCPAASLAPVTAKHGMVVSEQKIASQVGVDILQQGGNAVDAAVAVGYALAVVNPCCGNIGGGGFALIHLANKKEILVNFREKAPLASKPTMYLDEKGNIIPDKSTYGYAAVAVPGTVLGLDEVLRKYGTLTRQQVMTPAIQLADKGFILSKGDVDLLQKEGNAFHKQSYQIGDRLIQKDLANTLRLIAHHGPDVFYKGIIANTIVNESQKHGGILTLEDFRKYTIEELTPVRCDYRGYKIISAPPPSSGGVTLCEMLNILEGYTLSDFGFHSARGSHYIIEAMRYAFADRNNNLGDPNFIKNPVELLISKKYAEKIRQHIKPDRATPSDELFTQTTSKEGVNTTHYSVVDKFGNAVAITYTLNSFFGAKVIAGNTGFFLNNEMDDFTARPGAVNQFSLVQGEANIIQPEKRPLSSMTPTLIMKDNQPIMVLGSPGGPRIITSVLQTILNVLDYGMDIQVAVDAPRFHQQWFPDWVDVEKPAAFAADVTKKLVQMGYHFKTSAPWGAVEAIYIDPATKLYYGGSDDRKPAGGAVGY